MGGLRRTGGLLRTARRLEAVERMRADGARTRRTSGRADGRTGERRISEGKTPNLMRHLTWPWEIQCGRPRVTVKLLDLPPPSQ